MKKKHKIAQNGKHEWYTQETLYMYKSKSNRKENVRFDYEQIFIFFYIHLFSFLNDSGYRISLYLCVVPFKWKSIRAMPGHTHTHIWSICIRSSNVETNISIWKITSYRQFNQWRDGKWSEEEKNMQYEIPVRQNEKSRDRHQPNEIVQIVNN